MDDKILYHGSRGGLEGKPQPISRARCDFGKGMYFGDNMNQTKGLVVADITPVFYTVKLRLSEIPENRILVLDGLDWLYTVMANRKRAKTFSQLEVAKEILQQMDNYDVIIGPIADDRMNEAIREFENNSLSEYGLLACLSKVDFGNQYVLKTDFACSKLDILSEREMQTEEAKEIQLYAETKREEGTGIVQWAKAEYLRKGRYLKEIIEDEYEKENKDYDFER
jgi:hypothetical protein